MPGELKSVEQRLAAAYIGWRDSAGCGDTGKVIAAFRELEAAERAYRSGREGEYEKFTDPATGETLYRRPAAPPATKPTPRAAITHFKQRVIDCLQTDHPQAAGIVAKLPVWVPSEEEAMAAGFEESVRQVAPQVEAERRAHVLTSDVMDFRVRAAKPEPAPSPALAALESIIARSPHPERFAEKKPLKHEHREDTLTTVGDRHGAPCGKCKSGAVNISDGKCRACGSQEQAPCPECRPGGAA